MDLLAGSGHDATHVRSGYEQFFRAHFRGVARAAALIAGDAPAGQDLAQEAFLRLYERWNSMASDEHARNFAYKVAVNLARSHVRKHLRLIPSGLDREAPARTPAVSEAWLDAMGILGTLPQRQRACVVLIDLVDMDAETAGRTLGISPNTVRVHLMRGRQALRRALGETPSEGDEDEG